MKNVLLKPNQSTPLAAVAIAGLLLSSCSLKNVGQSVTVSIPLPGGHQAFMKPLTSWIAEAWASTTTAVNLDSAPSALSDFDCYGVNIAGPGIDLNPNVSCTDTSNAPAILGGFVAAGQTSIDLDVPAGPTRSFDVFGVKSLVGCPDFKGMLKDGSIQFSNNMGHLYRIGSTQSDISADSTVTIHVSYNSAAPLREFSSCQTRGENGAPHLWSTFSGASAGTVNSTKTVGTTTYIAGSFDYVGPTTKAGVLTQESNYTLINGAHVNGTVRCAAPDGSGGFYIGGSIQSIDMANVTNFAHITSNGAYDSNLSIGADGTNGINVCAYDGKYLFLGGDFVSVIINGTSRTQGLFAMIDLSTTTPTLMSTPSVSGTSAAVTAMAVDSGAKTVYLGGTFTAPASKLTAIVYTSAPTAVTTANTGATAINAIAVDTAISPHKIYVTGNTINGTAGIDRFSAGTTTWDGWGATAFSGSTGKSIAMDSSKELYLVYAGTADLLYRMDRTAGSASGTQIYSASNAGDVISALALTSSGLYVAHQFLNQHNQIELINSPASASGVIQGSNPVFYFNNSNTVNVIAGSGTMFYGGNFTSIGGVVRSGLAGIDLNTGTATGFNPTSPAISGAVRVDSDGTRIYAAITVSGSTYEVAAFAMDGSLKWADPVSAQPMALAVGSNGTVYVGGGFTTFNSTARNSFAAVNGSDGTFLSGWNPFSTASVYTILPVGDVVYVGGSFSYGSPASQGVVAFDTTGAKLSTWTSNPGLTNNVNSLAILPDGNLVANGPNALQEINAKTGATIAAGNLPTIASANKILVVGNTLYLGTNGSATDSGGLLAYDLTATAPTALSGFSAGINYNAGNQTVWSIEMPFAGSLIVGGTFQQVNLGGQPATGKMSWGLAALSTATGNLY